MKVSIVAVGRLRAGPEHELISDYLHRFDRTGRALGLGPAKLIEVEDKKNLGIGARLKNVPVSGQYHLWYMDTKSTS